MKRSISIILTFVLIITTSNLSFAQDIKEGDIFSFSTAVPEKIKFIVSKWITDSKQI